MNKPVHLRSVALPAEHGGWGFVLEPIIVGLIAAPSNGGLVFSIAVMGMFLLHQPSKLVGKALLKRRMNRRAMLAARFMAFYGAITLIALIVVITQNGIAFLLPFAFALPLMLIQFVNDLQNKSRSLISEVAGAISLGFAASSIMLLDDKSITLAFVAWGLLIARTLPAIVYVRARLRLERDKPFSPYPSTVTHIIALAATITCVILAYTHWLIVIISGILLGRAIWGLSRYRTPVSRPAIIGFQEIGYGLLYAVGLGLSVS